MKPTKVIADLIVKYMEDNLSSTESHELEKWLQEDDAHKKIFEELIHNESLLQDTHAWIALKSEDEKDWLDQFKHKTVARIKPSIKTPKKNTIYYWLPIAAASIVLIFSISFLITRENAIDTTKLRTLSIAPGANKAELILSNGEKINLREDKKGIIMESGLTYDDGTPITATTAKEDPDLKATLLVPSGGKYQVTLSDGTKVWLNSQSKLTYSLQFPDDMREVYIEGEAYFDVAQVKHKKRKVPFIVNTRLETIEVTGTEFNISAYKDDNKSVTTLVEGSVKIHNSKSAIHLVPNEQATGTGTAIRKKTVDVQPFTAWIENKFMFHETELREVMKSLSRWYNIDISYIGSNSPTYFYGEIGRDKNLREVLKVLEKSGVKFRLQQDAKKPKLIVIN